ncbi:serine protease inhibitor 42Dd-like [Drosophila albomicans]|uniref:Serine protease inhibitor 42Dd-like n=1 Tax=Drosophila albomicans TaxID=7291 RepID=A0A6P8WM19_DROAB|nr:serine protease inhibitor 42Dd-like [Drosophila albomicans]XP_051860074.1 serine protease inhibitor 42Dd-like [Drosophila albomicans]
MKESFNEFANDVFDALVAGKNAGGNLDSSSNVIISPLSIQSSLLYALMGADGDTAAELRNGLKLESDDRQQIAKEFQEFWKKNCIYGDKLTLRSVNRLFVNQTQTLKTDFKKLAEDYFLSEPETLKFADAVQATKRINDLVMNDTENKINHLLSPECVNGDTSAVLVNALYFKGKFEKPFTPESTMSDDFYVDKDNRIEVDMMYQEDKFKYADLPDLDARACQLPYEGSNISLLILLPKRTTGLLDLQHKLKSINLSDIERRMAIEDVEIAMPKFCLEFDLELKETLNELGISSLFEDSADLSRLFTTSSGQKISAAKHRGYISVNEAGSEAAAATYMKIVPMMLNMQKKTFKVDHPFLFFIRNSNVVFFAGRFMEPRRKTNPIEYAQKRSLTDSMIPETSLNSPRNSS